MRSAYTDLLSNPAYTTFKSNWAWANFTDEKNQAHQGQPALQRLSKGLMFSGGVRLAKRDVDQTFGRYLIDAATLGTSGVGAGTPQGNCCIAPGQSGTESTSRIRATRPFRSPSPARCRRAVSADPTRTW